MYYMFFLIILRILTPLQNYHQTLTVHMTWNILISSCVKKKKLHQHARSAFDGDFVTKLSLAILRGKKHITHTNLDN